MKKSLFEFIFPRYSTSAGKRVALRRFYYDNHKVIYFALILSALTVLSYWLSTYIPVAFYENYLVLMLHAMILLATIVGAGSLLKHGGGVRSKRIVAGVFLIWALVELGMIIFSFVSTSEPILTPGNKRLSAQPMLVGNICAWLLLIYPTEVLRPGWLNWWKAFLLLLPVIVLTALYYTTSVDLRILIALYPVFIFFMVIRNLDAYRRWCEENFSSLEDMDVQWIWQYLIMIFIVGASYYYMCVTRHPTRAFTQLWLLLFLIVYTTEQVLFRHDLWSTVQQNDRELKTHQQATHETVEQPQPESQSELQPSVYAACKQQLDEYMAQEKPYLDKDLRLLDLMKVIPLNRTYLSQLINSEYGCNFYQFVTSYRIAEAMRLMTKYPDMKLQEVADRSGFSSPAVFSRTFVREIGVTPTDWLATNH